LAATMEETELELDITEKTQRSVLWVLLLINALMFVIELSAGLFAQSTGLIGDSLDMFADAVVYGVGLYAVGRSLLTKANAAMLSGAFQIILAFVVFADVIRRFVVGSDPHYVFMIAVGGLALTANTASLIIIWGQRKGEVHMRASFIFSQNDVIVNLGVILGGVLVWVLGSRFPDLIVGGVVSLAVLIGGLRIVRDAADERRRALSGST
jgi:cation diffusion facilitator family transporter